MARIGVDLDGVLYDFGGSLRDYLVYYLDWPVSLCGAPKEWHFYREWGLTDDGFRVVCNQAADAGVLFNSGRHLNPIARTALEALRKHGHTLHIITDRQFGSHPGVSHAQTALWLSEEKVPYDTLTFSGDKTIVATDYMVDDKLSNYDALDATGCTPYLLNQPWNQSPGPRRRVTNVWSFVDEILRLESAVA